MTRTQLMDIIRSRLSELVDTAGKRDSAKALIVADMTALGVANADLMFDVVTDPKTGYADINVKPELEAIVAAGSEAAIQLCYQQRKGLLGGQ